MHHNPHKLARAGRISPWTFQQRPGGVVAAAAIDEVGAVKDAFKPVAPPVLIPTDYLACLRAHNNQRML